MTANPLAVLMPGFVGLELPDWLAARLRAGLGGVCVFGENIAAPAQLRALCDSIFEANPDALIAIDEEGGDVTRLFYSQGSPFPGNAILGRIDDEAFTAQVAVSVGEQLRTVGCNLDFAPDADTNSNPRNPVIGVRSFGAEPQLVARHTVAWTRGLQAAGVAASVKHFPGHGDTAQDSHLALPVVDRSLQQLRERELVPFIAAIGAGTKTIMTSHILLPQLDPDNPATLSRRILQGLLREELGFGGVIVSDALDMAGASGDIGIPAAAVRAIAAGCDLLCIGTRNTDAQIAEIERAFTTAIADGALEATRLADAAERTTALGHELAEARETSEARAPQEQTPAAPDFPLARTAAVFDVRPGVTPQKRRTVIVTESTANAAVGQVPWGPAGGLRIREGQPLPQIDGQPVLVGRDNHLHPWVLELADALRQQHPSTIVVDMGWPADDRKYADVATFGASGHVGRALDAWLEGTL
ncbi:beta-N-acetylhexosaminidase [Homoserinimonas aerilata]|uniref:Beta-N-acetylhexosaminidase n=1 Tax=Homoserinimonas aerilata TaxID=1162970 RepID=A0A542YFY8_9MICO|nr:glycoside hydrolase family 3 N-terminal domain-containing protein [Homoserinimonas aerilata]TQL46998.1 beta-N-acetylhexosaminidase [Homoserinimonas aerilata]